MDLNQHLSEAEKADILRMHGEPKIYAKLVESLAPSVFGHLEVKRGAGLCASYCFCVFFSRCSGLLSESPNCSIAHSVYLLNNAQHSLLYFSLFL